MTTWNPRANELFLEALELSPAGERRGFLDRACGDDAALRAEVDALLEASDQAGSFLAVSPDSPTRSMAPPPPAEEAGAVIGPYKLLQQIGEGGMGTVYMAEQERPVRRKVALKVIKAGMDSRQVIARFEAERQALAMMDHVNIARVLDAGATDSGRPYFVMELVRGVPITRYCDDNRLTPRQRLELFVPICRAIQHAHQKGVIHRDIKPSNVLVTLYDGKPVPKVIDFGVAKATEQRLTERTLFTQYGTLVGTLEYMSPEQAEMSALGVDTRSDIYSLGVLLYELLTGGTPLGRERLRAAAFGEILRMIKEEEPPRPSTRLSDSGEALASISAQRHMEPARLTKLVRGELDWIVMKALEKDRNRRYETVNGLAADVRRYLDDEPVQACPPSVGYRFRKFARRNKAGLGVAGLVVSFLILLGGGAGWAARDRATRQAALGREVTRALEEAEASYRLDRTPEALAAVKRAEVLLAGGGGGEGLRQRVRRWRTDLDLVARLDEVRLEGAAVKHEHFDHGSADTAYREAFRRHGLDLDALDPDGAAGRLRASAIRDRLVVALDHWAAMNQVEHLPSSGRLLALARRADPDPWRSRLREAFARQDAKALAGLARDEQRATQAPETLLLLARGLSSTGQQPLCIEVLSAAQSRYAADFWINETLGMALRGITPPRPGAAVGFLRAAVALRPDSPGALINLAWALESDQGTWVHPEAEFRGVIRLKPDYAEAHSGLALMLARKGDRVGAVTALREAIRLRPGSAWGRYSAGNALVHMRMLDEGITEYREALRLEPKYAEAHVHLGVALAMKGLRDQAIAEYRSAILLDPGLRPARWNLAGCLANKGSLDEAVAEAREAIRRFPDDAQPYLVLGQVAMEKRAWDEAIVQLGKAIELDPKSAKAHNTLGAALEQKGRLDEAIAACRRAIRLEPDFAVAHTCLGLLLAGKGRLDEAIAACRRATRLDPNSAVIHSNLGSVLERKGLPDEAIAAFREASVLDPKHSYAHVRLAWLLATHPDSKLRDPGRAIEMSKAAVALNPADAFAWQTLAWAQYRAGDWKPAVAAMEKVKELGSAGDSLEWFLLAMAHWQLGEKEVGRKWYDRAAEWMAKNQPKNEEMRQFRAEAAALMGIEQKEP